MKKVLIFSLLLLAMGCGVRYDSPSSYLAQREIVPAKGGRLTVCSGFGCSLKGTTQLSSDELLQLDVMFTPRPATPEEERQIVARAVAWLETIVGLRVGTQGDLARNKRNHARYGQLDCIAEATNTTVYLLLMQQKGLLAYHTVAAPENRGGSVFTAHNTAVLREQDGKEYAIDSWFHVNGDLPEVVEMTSWKQGFDPDENLSNEVESLDITEKKKEDHGV